MNGFNTYRIRFITTVSLLIAINSLSSNFCVAQDSTVAVPPAMQVEVEEEKPHSPKSATILSAAVPGLGQVYNRKYWKVPLIYAGAGALLYVISANSARYKTFKNAYSLRIDGDTTTIDIYDIQMINNEPKYSEEALLNVKDFYRRNRDVSYIFLGVLYMLNIVDAAVDAHFFDYEITDDLSLEVRPALLFSAGRLQTTGIGLTLRL